MRITRIDIKNYRKLKHCQIEISEKETVFVGANNSGKTSAMDALKAFLKSSDISSEDFTISNWPKINEIARAWITDTVPNFSKSAWQGLVPAIDFWLSVKDNELHYVSHLLPTLDWNGGELGVRLIYEPQDIEELYKKYKEAYDKARQTEGKRKVDSTLQLWPKTMQDFLSKVLQKQFSIKSYLLDPAKNGKEQTTDENAEPIIGNPFKGLIKIDMVNAQRGLSDPHSGEGQSNNDRRLSSQFRDYFQKHLNPEELPEESDLSALEAMEMARREFDKKLKKDFNASIGELENLSYPGFSDPKIQLNCKINPIDGLNHDAAVQFDVFRDGGLIASDPIMTLPEKYNGLGYQNLISMIFNLIRYRDEWMRVGKAGNTDNENPIEPLHIVMVEEPEAHLHAQVQQVFIRKAYEVLRNHPDLKKEDSHLSTQLLISTHSSHIAHEIDFRSLRYFKRLAAQTKEDAPFATVVNLSTVFGEKDETAKFATRYLRSTHCDLFFADAAILVEGSAERMLVPHFIKAKYPDLNKSYVSLLEIGGSHAYRLKPLIECLGIPTLVITDLDAVEKRISDGDSNRTTYPSVRPEKEKSYYTGNDTIKNWAPAKSELDAVLATSSFDKISNGSVRIAYQYEIKLRWGKQKEEQNEEGAIPYTFEDALVLSNVEYFKNLVSPKGLLKKMQDAVSTEPLVDACQAMFAALNKPAKKAEMALEILWTTEPQDLNPPLYISEGLDWLQTLLKSMKKDFETPHVSNEVDA